MLSRRRATSRVPLSLWATLLPLSWWVVCSQRLNAIKSAIFGVYYCWIATPLSSIPTPFCVYSWPSCTLSSIFVRMYVPSLSFCIPYSQLLWCIVSALFPALLSFPSILLPSHLFSPLPFLPPPTSSFILFLSLLCSYSYVPLLFHFVSSLLFPVPPLSSIPPLPPPLSSLPLPQHSLPSTCTLTERSLLQ